MAEDDEILLGKLALKLSFVSASQLEDALRDQDFYTPGTPLGEILIDKGFISRDQLDRLLETQKKNLAKRDRYIKDSSRKDTLFGKIAIRLGFVDEHQLNWCLREQGKPPSQGGGRRLGAYLVENEFMSHEQVQRILEEQQRGLCECPDCDRRYNIIGFTPDVVYKCKFCNVPLYRVGPQESGVDDDIDEMRRIDL